MNWRGKPLIDYQVVVDLIKNTTTKNGLKVFARLDKKQYTKGRKFSDEEINKIPLEKHDTYSQWNYSILSK